jgi:hypothetical protein
VVQNILFQKTIVWGQWEENAAYIGDEDNLLFENDQIKVQKLEPGFSNDYYMGVNTQDLPNTQYSGARMALLDLQIKKGSIWNLWGPEPEKWGVGLKLASVGPLHLQFGTRKSGSGPTEGGIWIQLDSALDVPHHLLWWVH